MLKVVERKTSKEAIATELEDGRYKVDFGGGEEVKEVASSTFKRQFSVLGELGSTEVADAVLENETPAEGETESDESSQPSEESQQDAPAEQTAPEVEVQDNLDELLEGADEVQEGSEPTPEKEIKEAADKKPVAKPSAKEEEGHSTEINLIDWKTHETRGGKTDKVTSIVSVNNLLLHITEYAGYITDVRVQEEVPEHQIPENDPDARFREVYRSPKSSLKDTLEWMQLDTEEAKWARKVITQLRKEVKNQMLHK